jgi:D-beta-D-heptose 7-phosphate kinase/D-beta-D-heptose 1-phosphate adenosyltransferase
MGFIKKIKTPAALSKLLSDTKKKDRKVKIVFTNGCFDLLHKGHVTYLEQAKALGDFLVVGLNADQSVKALKGPQRPVNPLEDRLEVIAALESVNWVTWFDEDTPLALIKKIRPDIYVKGGDWKKADLPEVPLVEGWGGRVKILTFVKGRSTTRLIEKMRPKRTRR